MVLSLMLISSGVVSSRMVFSSVMDNSSVMVFRLVPIRSVGPFAGSLVYTSVSVVDM